MSARRSTLLTVHGRRYARRRYGRGDEPPCWRGMWVLERLDAPRDLVGTFATAAEADEAAELDARLMEVNR